MPSGGAAIAARRQAEALVANGIECNFVSIKEDEKAQKINVTKSGGDIAIVLPSNIWSQPLRISNDYLKDNRTNISNTPFSFLAGQNRLG